MNTTTQLSTLLLLTAATALTACGHADVSSQNPAPAQTQTQNTEVTPTPAPTWMPGIYVAAGEGSDSNTGTPDSPMQTIDAALQTARENGKSSIYLFGGPTNGSYDEIVVLKQATNIYGGLCRGSKPMVVDTANCATTIIGGSPSLIVDGVNASTTIADVTIQGIDSAQNDGSTSTDYFQIPTIGCIGRGKTPMSAGYLPCPNGPGTDAQGRTIPQSSMAVAMIASSAVVFRNDHIRSGNAASGLPGADGANGTVPDKVAGLGGTPASGQTTVGGMAGAPGVNHACPAANGTAGGEGGHFNAVTVSTSFLSDVILTGPVVKGSQQPTGYSGATSAINGSLSAGAGGEFDWRSQEGAAGQDGDLATAPAADGNVGNLASTNIDLTLLVAGTGSNGANGFDGLGGTGGGGGAPGTQIISEKRDSNGNVSAGGFFQQIGISGATGNDSSLSYTANNGETPAGGGGGGGAGGCGGQGGLGGQGGATSVAAFLSDSGASFPGSVLVAGNGGNGARGGRGGLGAAGGSGADGGFGAKTNSSTEIDTVSTSHETAGTFLGIFGGHVSYTSNSTVVVSKSTSSGGNGGKGGDGQMGGAGGNGADGAGGGSIGVIEKGASLGDATQATIELGQPGLGGTSGPTGLQIATYSIH